MLMAKKESGEETQVMVEKEEFQVKQKVDEVIVEKKGGKKKPTTVEELPGVGEATAAKLAEAGYDTLEVVAVSLPAELAEVAGIGEGTAAKIVNAAREALEMGFETGDVILERRKLVGHVTTGSKALDELLGGKGIQTQTITESYGRFSSGKSQLGFQLCVNAQQPPEKGGLGGTVAFIDVESTFRPERIAQIAQGAGMNPEEVLKNIYHARASNSDHQMLLLDKLNDMIKEKNIRLIVVDSLTSAFRSDYIGRGNLAERQQKLNKHVHTLQRYADMYNIAVYVTNQVMDRPDIMFGDPTAPVGGNIVAHVSGYRLYLRRSKEDRRIAKLVDSPDLPDGEVVFRVCPEGVRDVD